MKQEQRTQLEQVIDGIVNENADASTSAFHEYLRDKIRGMLVSERAMCDEEDEKDEDDKDEDDKDEDEKDDEKSEDKEKDSDESEDEDEK